MQTQKCIKRRQSSRDGIAFSGIFRPREGTTFLLLGNQTVVFCETSQRIYALNPTAALIWCRLEEHDEPAAICQFLAAKGVDPNLAAQHVGQAIRHWLKLGLLKGDAADVFTGNNALIEKTFRIKGANFSVTMQFPTTRLAKVLAPFQHFADRNAPRDHVLALSEADGLIHAFHNNDCVISCAPRELVPAIKAYVTERMIADSAPQVVFHAACLVRGGKSLLISGKPGAGKTTLALQLVADGFEFGGDDIAMIGPDGRVAGVPFAPAIKPGAWNIVSTFRPDLKTATIHQRPDGKRVRYLNPENLAADSTHPVGWIVFIRRKSGPALLRPIEPVEAMRGLMHASYTVGGRLNLTACRALKQTLEHAKTFELTYSTLKQASDAIGRLFHDS